MFRKEKFTITMPTVIEINCEQITFSNLKCQIYKDNEIRFIDAFVEEFITPGRDAKEHDLTLM